ncbi:hypothetical protein [Streptomyces sp. x-19]|uniref:hypothetical protein n=1 Tax=Streptomyces sp. x-19 TaxID=2789280 RepID=UPI003980DA56
MTVNDRCQAAHPNDPTPCVGPHDAVTVLWWTGISASGCEPHATRFLASLDEGTVLSGSVDGAAKRVREAARAIHPFPWMTYPLRTEPRRRSHVHR